MVAHYHITIVLSVPLKLQLIHGIVGRKKPQTLAQHECMKVRIMYSSYSHHNNVHNKAEGSSAALRGITELKKQKRADNGTTDNKSRSVKKENSGTDIIPDDAA